MPAKSINGFVLIGRFFCGRRGAAMARMMIAFWTIAGTGFLGFATWAANEAWSEFKGLRAGVSEIHAFIAGDDERWKAMRHDLDGVSGDMKLLGERVNGIDVRLARQEGRQAP